jgi:N-acylneuraminate cytidylyltransferase
MEEAQVESQPQLGAVALVPARGGSKGIPRKNIRDFAGKPLLYWVCLAAEQCPHIEATFVATDDPEIAAVARGLGLSKLRVIERAADTATDTASTESVMFDFAGRVDFTHIALLQATSPFLHASDLSQAFERMGEGHDSVLSVVRQKRFLWRREADATARAVNYDPRARPRRQDFEGFLVENGAFYLTSREVLLAHQCRLGERVAVVEMDEETYFELDDEVDWRIMEGLFHRRQRRALGDLDARLQNLRLIATDVDGCLTDSGMYYGEAGEEFKKFNTRDGKAFELLHQAGFLTAIITAENSPAVTRRAAKLRASAVHLGAQDKVAVMQQIMAEYQLRWDQVAYLGDDLGDIPLLQQASVSACPADAIDAVRTLCDRTLATPGGRGAFREFTEWILAGR